MNILQPQIIKIGQRRYRRNPFTLSFQEPDALEPYEEETQDMYTDTKSNQNRHYRDYEDEECGLDMNKCKLVNEYDEGEDLRDIEFTNGYYSFEMRVSETYFGFIIGRNGEKKSNLERDTDTVIRIPRRGQGDLIKIEGNDKKSVASCRNRLQLIISTARHQKPFTHLLTFPLKFEKLKQKFKEFEDQVLRHCSQDRGVHESIFQLPNKLHLTICTCTLLSEFEVDQAVNLLDQCRNSFIKEILNSRQLNVRIKGLEYMNDDPSDVDVLYAKIQAEDSNNMIQIISDKLMEKFGDSGLSKKQFDRVKIHATVMNTLRRQDHNLDWEKESEAAEKKGKERESFDARNVLKMFSDFDFGSYKLNEIHLSLRYSAAADGYYECISKINF